MVLDFAASRLRPFDHQVEDTASLVEHPFYLITSEMRTGKTKIVIDAAQFLFMLGIIDRVIVICPEPVRSVWFDPETGELAKHLWYDTHAKITEFHSTIKQWTWAHRGPMVDVTMCGDNVTRHESLAPQLKWIVTNYDYVRPFTPKDQKKNDLVLKTLLKYCTPKTLIVFDECSALTNHTSETYKACLKLRRACGRVVAMDGALIDTPIHLFSICNLLDPSILDCGFITHFRARYAVMGGFKVGAVKKKDPKTGATIFVGGRPTQVLEWTNLDDIQRRMLPYTVRRLQKHTLAHVPKKKDAITLYASMTADEWSVYRKMRDDMIVMLQDGNASIAQQAITKLMRLSQITGGFLGGVEDAGLDTACLDCSGAGCDACEGSGIGATRPITDSVIEIGRSKLDLTLTLLDRLYAEDPNLKIIIWCRFHAEVQRLLREAARRYPLIDVAGLHGGQTKRARNDVKRLLKPETAPPGPVIVAGTLGTGSFGLDFSAAHTSVNHSYTHSLRKFLQSGDRVFGPGQTSEISYYDLIAVGPRGQKTYDSVIVQARRAKQDLATWTTDAWVRALQQPEESAA